jgi:hypothetical protein
MPDDNALPRTPRNSRPSPVETLGDRRPPAGSCRPTLELDRRPSTPARYASCAARGSTRTLNRRCVAGREHTCSVGIGWLSPRFSSLLLCSMLESTPGIETNTSTWGGTA